MLRQRKADRNALSSVTGAREGRAEAGEETGLAAGRVAGGCSSVSAGSASQVRERMDISRQGEGRTTTIPSTMQTRALLGNSPPVRHHIHAAHVRPGGSAV